MFLCYNLGEPWLSIIDFPEQLNLGSSNDSVPWNCFANTHLVFKRKETQKCSDEALFVENDIINIKVFMKQKTKIIIIALDNGKVAVCGDSRSGKFLPFFVLSKGEQPLEKARDFVSNNFNVVGFKIEIVGAVNNNLELESPSVDLVYRVNLSGKYFKIDSTLRVSWEDVNRRSSQILTDSSSVTAFNYVFGQPTELSLMGEIRQGEAIDYLIYTDGASRGNPGHSAAAYAVYDNGGSQIISSGEYLGITTSIVAEYYAVKIALEAVIEMGARKVECRIDSLSVVNQLNSVYSVKNRDAWPIHESIIELMKKLQMVRFVHVNREYNQEADQIANNILDNYVGTRA